MKYFVSYAFVGLLSFGTAYFWSTDLKTAGLRHPASAQEPARELADDERVQQLLTTDGFACGDIQRRLYYGRDIGEPAKTDQEGRRMFDRVGRNCNPGSRYTTRSPLELAVTLRGPGFQIAGPDLSPMHINHVSMKCDRVARIDGVYRGSFAILSVGAGWGGGTFIRQEDGARCKLRLSSNIDFSFERGKDIEITVKPYSIE